MHCIHIKGDIPRIAMQECGIGIFIVDRRVKYILCHIDHNHAGAPRPCDVERFLHDPRDVVHIFYEIVVLRDRRRDADNIRLLKGILADVRIRHLSRDADHRHGVHMRRRDARHEICRARSRGRKGDADLARRSGIAVRRVRCPLLVARQDMRKIHLIYFIVEREDCPARIAKHDLDALRLQALQESACTIHLQ